MPPSRNSRYSTTRQKSCQQCSTARARCDRKETCGRCDSRGLTCTYPTATSRDTSPPSENSAETLMPTNSEELQIENSTDYQINKRPQSMAETATASAPGPEPEPVANANPDLICPINPDDIQNRWLNAYVPLPGQEAKNYSTNISQLISRTLKSYGLKAIQGRPPPFIHPTHLSLPPISTCFTLLKLRRIPMEDESVVAEILKREMTRLHEGHTAYSDMELFGAFQAYLIYTMVLFFKFTPPSMDFFRQAMINLQEIACATSRQGLACMSEKSIFSSPKWEAWHVVEAKRRTLYTMYFMDNMLSVLDGFPTYIGHELKGLYAPSSNELWTASRTEWDQEYRSYRSDWGQTPFRLDELWPASSDAAEHLEKDRQRRTEKWLKDVDGFGMMLYAVTSCTYEN
ncbi:uncharacterized protein B0J16DRAFT_416943 [Fusarium flagelliforme]|uniref:Zn(2)-C6 fungal-type domain-containing protein n=1 Tax=Fusarium flagelliforme TaxID=2675880 RepID=A0A395M862_9HYPO|nr:uncharacterized protein B0J16DRAFT_416943 [Fusarium flagelliforme]KAH7179248.1 hypothetical protein B0J16DRAFT_416943 [Fusarium flagelliforme]RFN44097.1 hypothetical protein FIE12Z_11645 [Fusarium flagelliforme]